ncbi:hypothetical protein C1886_20705 [Pseudomonas sp. FW300-N1A1]|nr:hypothetical protein C1886_20705 [Pseudomonas sp. FW300-N1A1]
MPKPEQSPEPQCCSVKDRVAQYIPPWRASLLALGCRAAPKTVVEFVMKDRSRFVGCALRTSASKLARHGSLTRFKPFLTEQYCASAGFFSDRGSLLRFSFG